MDRRTTIKWVLAVAAATPGMHGAAYALEAVSGVADTSSVQGYGTDPDLSGCTRRGELWPLTSPHLRSVPQRFYVTRSSPRTLRPCV